MYNILTILFLFLNKYEVDNKEVAIFSVCSLPFLLRPKGNKIIFNLCINFTKQNQRAIYLPIIHYYKNI